MQKYQNVSQDTLGNIIQAATISVWTDSSHTVAATIYSDNGVTLLPSNTVTTDTLGNFYFYAANGRYYLKQTKSGTTTVFYDDVLLFDPAASGGGASSVTFVQSGTGAPTYGFASRTVSAKIGETQVSVKDFKTSAGVAVAGDGVQDDTTGIQAAIDWCISNQRKLYFPVGNYKITSPLLILYFSGGAFTGVSLEIEGEKFSYQTDGTYQKSARISPTFVNTFAIGIQNARSVRIKDLTLLGLNTISLSADFHEMMTNSTFVTGSCRDSRYSPYAGICIDPFGTSAPADGGYPGLSSYYVASAGGSSRTTLEGVICKNFVVGTMISPNGTTQNSEDVSFRDCQMIYNKVGVSIGQSQSRNVNWYGGNCAFNLYGFDCNTYGSQNGANPHIYGCNMSGKYLFNAYNSSGTPLLVEGIHAESFGSIGFIGGGAASTADTAKFLGCTFAFTDFGTGVFADHHMVAQGSVEFDTCEFNQTSITYQMPARLYHRDGTNLTFRNCSVAGAVQGELWLAPTKGVNGNEQDGLRFENCSFNDNGGRGASQSLLSHSQNYFSAANYNKTVAPFGAIYRFYTGTATLIYFVGNDENSVSLGSLTVTTGSNGSATFTASDGTIIRTGDLIYTTTTSAYENYAGSTFNSSSDCIGIVSNVNGNNITITGWPQSLVTGTYALTKRWWSRFHQASTGDTHTNTTLDNVTNPSAWANGNAIKGAGIPAGTYIASGGGTATLTLSKATTATASGIRLFDADVYSLTGTAV